MKCVTSIPSPHIAAQQASGRSLDTMPAVLLLLYSFKGLKIPQSYGLLPTPPLSWIHPPAKGRKQLGHSHAYISTTASKHTLLIGSMTKEATREKEEKEED